MTSQMPKPFHCSDCGKEFSKEKKLLSHFKVHSTEKSYKCEVCKVTLSHKALYKKHVKTHNEKDKHPCPKCGKTFKKQSWLKKHMDLQCQNPNQIESKFICKYCGRMYDSLTGVRSHLLKGKHMKPVFKCHACMWICITSKSLFIHVLQHTDADINVIGLSREKRLEYYSTAKVRSKVSLYRPRPKVASTGEITSMVDQKSKEIIMDNEEEEVLQNESTPSQNVTLTAEAAEETNITNTADNTLQNEDDLGRHQPLESTEITEERVNDIILQIKNNTKSTNPVIETTSLLPPMSQSESVESTFQNGKNDIDKKESQSNIAFSEQNVARGSLSPSEKTTGSEDRIPKKMPKLVSLYPEEETLMINSTCSVANNSLLLQNEMPLPLSPASNCSPANNSLLMQNEMPLPLPPAMIPNSLSADNSTMMHNEVLIPYTTPLANTMYLPPLFLLPNNLAINQGIRQHNPFQMRETLFENQPMIDKPTGVRTSNFQNISNKMIQPRKIKHHTRLRKKFTTDMSLQESQMNTTTLTTHDINTTEDGQTMIQESKSCDKPEGFNLDDSTTHHQTRVQELKHEIIHVEANKMIDNTTNLQTQYNSKDTRNRRPNENNFWETLMGGDDSNKYTIHSSPAGKFMNDSSQFSDFHDDTTPPQPHATPGENIYKKVSEGAPVRFQQHGPIGGIEVEDYIKKFMWF